MLAYSDRVSAELLRRLQPRSVDSPEAVLALLRGLQAERTVLRGGINRNLERELATLDRVDGEVLWLRSANLEAEGERSLYLSFVHDGRPYFFWTRTLPSSQNGSVCVALPVAICEAERRDRDRHAVRSVALASDRLPRRVILNPDPGEGIEAWVADHSPEGLGVELGGGPIPQPGDPVRIRFVDGEQSGGERWAEVRHRSAARRPGWVKLGLSLRHGQPGRHVAVEHRERILDPGESDTEARSRAALRAKRGATLSESVRIVDFENEAGEAMRAIVDHVGDPRGAIAVVIPPAWGRTKETLLPLAATLLASFAAAGIPLVVVRFDGVRKRGESYRDPECRARGCEYHRLTFSQGVRDILATVRFLETSEAFRTSRAVVVSASASAIDARRAVAEDEGRCIRAWVSVNGAHDLQTTLRVISGGIDYLRGTEMGLEFGLQEYLGVEFDMDHMNRDALEHRIGFLDDACRDLAAIRVPVTWLHGRHDGWMDLDRVRQLLSSGDAQNRRLIEVPTGHQVRSSREAFEVFRLIAAEIGRMVLGRSIEPVLPDREALERRRDAERRRLPRAQQDLRGFWQEYLMGRDDDPGMELINATDVYRRFMRIQIEQLGLRAGERIADLGAGTGTLAVELARLAERPAGLVVDAIDYVRQALRTGRDKLAALGAASDLSVHAIEADLEDVMRGRALALRSEAYDAVVASLLVSYLSEPLPLLREILRILRPGGRLVLSSLRKDADASKIHLDVLAELQAGRGRELFKPGEARRVEEAARSYLNNAARIFDLEERGAFRFWDARELAALLETTGFHIERTQEAFGSPPQAVVIRARKR